MNELFLDLETGGVDERLHPITEVAVLDVRGLPLLHRRVVFDVAEARPDALELNGYDPELWDRTALPWPDVAAELAELFSSRSDAVLVGHCAHFEHRFLRRNLRAAGYDPELLPRAVVDTRALAHEHLEGSLDSGSLASLAAALGIVPRGPVHRALEDADLARRAYLKLRRAGPLRRLWWRTRARWLRRSR